MFYATFSGSRVIVESSKTRAMDTGNNIAVHESKPLRYFTSKQSDECLVKYGYRPQTLYKANNVIVCQMEYLCVKVDNNDY